MARKLSPIATALTALVLASAAQAGGGDYVFEGGSAKQQAQVRAALEASSFPWSLVPARITIHIAPGSGSYARPGHIWLDADLLDAGRFAWATVQDEYAHQVDFLLFDEAARARLNAALGGRDWCYAVEGLEHSAYGCERFASTLVWAYWPSRHNAYRPEVPDDESAAMAPAEFRGLVAEILGAPRLAAPARLVSSRR